MSTHTYDATPLTAGWTCEYCGAPLGDVHHVDPRRPGPAFCRPECAAAFMLRESRKSTRAPGQLGLALLVLGCLLLAALPAAAEPLSYIELQWYDRPIADPPAHILVPQPGFIEVGRPRTQADFFYRLRVDVHLEFPVVAAWPWLRALARTQTLVRGPGSELGHFNPVSVDLGGGLVLDFEPWTISLLASSKHGIDGALYDVTYNSITVRRALP